MIIYTNGCSHSENMGNGYSWPKVLANSLRLDYDNLSNYFDVKIKDNTCYNFAETSKGNDLIFYQTIEFINSCKNQNIKPNLFVIQWSGSSRYFKYKTKKSYDLYNPSDDVEKGQFHFEPGASNVTLHYMISLQEIFNKWGVGYYFINYMELDKNISKESLHQLDISKGISFDDNSHPLFDGFRNLIRKKGFNRDGAGHPNYFGHWYIALQVLDKIKCEPMGFFDSIYLAKIKPSLDVVYFYGDFMMDRADAKSKYIELGEGGEFEKNNIRKSIL